MSFRISTSRAKRNMEAQTVYDNLNGFKSDAGFDEYVTRLRGYDAQWRSRMERTNKPWDHASDFNPHLTFSKVEDIHSVLFGFFSTFSWFRTLPLSVQNATMDMMRERADYWTEILRWSMQNESNSVAFLDRFIHDGILYGAGFGEIKWQRDTREIRAELFIPDELRDLDEKEISDKDLVRETLGGKLIGSIKGGGDDGYMARFIDDDGEEKDGTFWIDREHPFRPEGEPVIIAQRDMVHYNAPHSLNRAPWDMLVPAHARSIQTATRYHVIDHLTFDQISRLAASGVFNAVRREDLRDLLLPTRYDGDARLENEYGVAGGGPSGETYTEVNEQRDLAMFGPRQTQTREKETFEVIWEYAFEDIDGDGFAESIIRAVTRHKKPTLLMRHRLEYLYSHGRRPHADWHLIPIDDRYNGMGVPELLERSQIEQNAYYQSRADVLEIITKPGGMYDPMSGLAPDEIKYVPGMMVKSRSPQTAFHPFNFPVDPGLLFQEQIGIDSDAERAIGSTDMGLGRSPQRPNAPRTLGGTAIMIRQQQLRMDTYMRRLVYGQGDRPSGLFEWVHQYRELMSAYMPETKEVQITGKNEVQAVNRADLQGRFSFLMSFDEELNNPQVRAANAVQRYGLLAQNPLFMQNPQALWNLTQDLMKATGLSAAEAILPPPQPGPTHLPMSQEEEFTILSRGVAVEVLMQDDHSAHMQAIQTLMANPEAMAQRGFTSATTPLLVAHLQQHQMFMQQAMQAAQAQQPGAPLANGNEPAGNNRLDGTAPPVTLGQTALGRPPDQTISEDFQI